ncbi:MAG: cytosine permease [Brucellaceae bacterium]|nr:cytosine permease [Brucellaceae bacterium]
MTDKHIKSDQEAGVTRGHCHGGKGMEQHKIKNRDEGELLANEYEHEPVPAFARRSVASVTTVWLGFPMIITCAMTGSMLVASMGFSKAFWAIITGNILLFLLVSVIGAVGARTGMNFALLASNVFGRRGYVAASGLLSLLILGWFAVQVGFTGNILHAAFGYNYFIISLIAGLFYLGITLIGIRGLHWIGVISVPTFIILGTWVAFDAVSRSNLADVWAYAGNENGVPMAFGVALTVVIGLFIDGATVSPDFNRWAKNSTHSSVAAFITFPIAHTYALLLGAVMTAALALPEADPFALDNMVGYILKYGAPWLLPLAIIFPFISFGSVCSHNLYMSAVNWSRIVGVKMRTAAVMLAVFGIAIAAGNVWSYFIPWLNLLGILVPPVGAIFAVHFYTVSRDPVPVGSWRPSAFAAWGVGSLAAYLIDHFAPQMSTSISSFCAAAIAYWIISHLVVAKQGAGREIVQNISN